MQGGDSATDGGEAAIASNAKPVRGPRGCATDRPFDFSKYPQRHIALRIAYHGHNHLGLSKQDHTTNTIETFVCEAMVQVKLIPPEGPEKFSRCARTDKGVSALGNAFSLMIRASCDESKPLDYCEMINSRLPPTIRVVGWCFVPDSFDGRFSCRYRVYRYYFANGSLDLERMRQAARFLVGTHNFRNFCKLDVVNVDNFVREILSVEIVSSVQAPGLISYCEIRGNAFLYHQIRCTMTVLFLVGRGLEDPEVVKQLLERGDAKPIYPMADDSPLILWDCHFDADVVQWNVSEKAMRHITAEMSDISTALLIRGVAAADMMGQLLDWNRTANSGACGSVSDGNFSDSCWESTGCDWTCERLQPMLSKRQSEMFAAAKRHRLSLNDKAQSSWYTPLMDRETEVTCSGKIGSLSGSKRARQEENHAKKMASRGEKSSGTTDDR